MDHGSLPAGIHYYFLFSFYALLLELCVAHEVLLSSENESVTEVD